MRRQSRLESEIATLMISALNLRNITPDQIDPNQDLIDSNLVMDSIDVLELSLAISKKYAIQVEADDNHWRDAFVNLEALANLVELLQVD